MKTVNQLLTETRIFEATKMADDQHDEVAKAIIATHVADKWEVQDDIFAHLKKLRDIRLQREKSK
jgi:hypothetical protein